LYDDLFLYKFNTVLLVHLQNVVFTTELLKVQQEALAERERAIEELRERYDVLSSKRRPVADELAGLWVDLNHELEWASWPAPRKIGEGEGIFGEGEL